MVDIQHAKNFKLGIHKITLNFPAINLFKGEENFLLAQIFFEGVKYFMINKLILFISFASLIACTSNEEKIFIDKEKLLIKMGEKNIEIPLAFSVVEQESNERNWKKIYVEFERKLGGLEDTIFFMPTRINTVYNEEILILDRPDYSVKKLSSSGTLLNKYGRYGKGPGEFLSPMEFDYFNNTLVILDPNMNKCEVFYDNLNYTINLQNNAFSVCMTTSNKFAVLQLFSPLDKTIIMEYDYKNKTTRDFTNIFSKNIDKDLNFGFLPVLIGNIERAPKNLLYLPTYLNFFIVYNLEGSIKGAYRYIDHTENYKYEINSTTEFNLDLPDPYRAFTCASVIDNNLASASLKGMRENKAVIYDFYSIGNGTYLYSIKLETVSDFTHIHITKDRIIYSTPENELKILKYSLID